MTIPGVTENRVTLSIQDGIADVRLNRPDKRNALDPALFASLVAVGIYLKTQTHVRAVVLSGNGASFCAGLDFASFHRMAEGGGASDIGALTDGGLTHLAQQICWVWQELEVPVIAALQGHALGGGIQLALGADIRYAHPDTQMSVREIHWGITPDMTGTLTLAQLVRPDIAKELVFTGRIFDAREAAQLGLVTHLTEQPWQDAMSLASTIAGRNPHAVRGAKHLFNRQFIPQVAGQFQAERDVIFSLIGSPNQQEAVKANFEKREPRFDDPVIHK
ncbi:crotonase/enoyl-CoA hydratase family protein [Pseudohongiella spirulinae]|uniref:Putative enoyl-CoA hydratase n=1 Tax=Pseudohongiella spirulinae TaxID=1249552 RepID=A0A0S2KCL7_9GAMM|nr:crotonase/enoyl-CoA hydratase family protein [Pseudohongiella spirulinae]ALO45977.1 Putative enoyl-CoA hydratase [Pseudohongiella spirulinae]